MNKKEKEQRHLYISYIEQAIECPVKYVSVGAERDAYIKMF